MISSRVGADVIRAIAEFELEYPLVADKKMDRRDITRLLSKLKAIKGSKSYNDTMNLLHKGWTALVCRR